MHPSNIRRSAAAVLGLTLGWALPGVAATVTVQQVPGRQFSPALVIIQPGDTVEWFNADTMPHTATSGPEGAPDGLFNSGDMPPGARFTHTFAAAGRFPYYCDYHGGMTGTVVVAEGTVVRTGPGRRFDPATVTVPVGGQVTWVNVDTMPHTATAGLEPTPSGLFASGNLDPGQSYSFTFGQPGSVDYFCEYHGGMTGQVVVQAAPTPVLLSLVKTGPTRSDLELSWSGSGGSFDVLRATRRDLADLTLLQAVGVTAFVDSNAVPPPPTLLLYQVR